MYHLVYTNQAGNLYDHPELTMVGRSGSIFREPRAEEMIPLPEGATLTLIPGALPIGIDTDGQFVLEDEDPYQLDKKIWAVGALLPQGYTRTLLPAYKSGSRQNLPLLGYAAVGWWEEKLYVAAVQTDEAFKWNPLNYNTPELESIVEKKINKFKDNRLIKHLANCALNYCCLTAQNIFYGRWEGGIPVSPTCNASCLGCISKQPAECCPSPQERINFIPTVDEVFEIGSDHLGTASEAIISFGQGCEGEPSLSADTIADSIYKIRKATPNGTINMNTNAGYTEGIRKICDAGLDSMRVSIISAGEKVYNSYYRPKNYSLSNVIQSIDYAKNNDVFVSLNLLVYPGLTDSEEEVDKLLVFLREHKIDMVQLRNLNIDPEFLELYLSPFSGEAMGIETMIKYIKEEVPGLTIGSYSRPRKK